MTEELTKECKICGEVKAIDAFFKRSNNSREPRCRKCRTAEERRHQNATPRSYMRGLLSKSKYGAKVRGLDFTLTIDEIVKIYDAQSGLCALSGVRMTYAKDGKGKKDLNISIDRIEQDRGYVMKPINVQLVCWRVNLMKHILPEHEMFWWMKNIVVHKNL